MEPCNGQGIQCTDNYLNFGPRCWWWGPVVVRDILTKGHRAATYMVVSSPGMYVSSHFCSLSWSQGTPEVPRGRVRGQGRLPAPVSPALAPSCSTQSWGATLSLWCAAFMTQVVTGSWVWRVAGSLTASISRRGWERGQQVLFQRHTMQGRRAQFLASQVHGATYGHLRWCTGMKRGDWRLSSDGISEGTDGSAFVSNWTDSRACFERGPVQAGWCVSHNIGEIT